MSIIRMSTVFACLFAAIFSCGTAFTTPTGNVNASCTSDQTECAFGCCPYQDAVCCADGSECCEHGQICIPIAGICIGMQDEENGQRSLFSKQPTVVQNSGAECPSGTTTCGQEYCCPLPDAVCCPDSIHCCPHGFKCDMERRGCFAESSNHTKSRSMEQEAVSVTTLSKNINKLPYKVCPGKKMVCPNYSSCCVDDGGNWSCCPSLTKNRIKSGDDCCFSMFGYICCDSEWFPICTFFGCV